MLNNLNLDEILKINFEKLQGEEEFKKALYLTDEEFNKLLQNGQNTTDENTPSGVRDSRIFLEVLDEEGEEQILPIDLVYEVEVTPYPDDVDDVIYKDIVSVIVYDIL